MQVKGRRFLVGNPSPTIRGRELALPDPCRKGKQQFVNSVWESPFWSRIWGGGLLA